jgi:predicted ATPase/class 3 adenylate cyclase/Tfp pilus assembly protein PilF
VEKLPSGTVTFLFTDIEGSTKRWEEQPDAMRRDLARHDALLKEIFTAHEGYVFKTIGDAFCVAFARASDAVVATVEAQQALHAEQWEVTGGIRVRMSLHTGMTEERDGDYFGPAVNRVARLLSAGHGGQVLLSLTTEVLVNSLLPPGTRLEDMGEHCLKDLQRSEHIYHLRIDNLPQNTKPLKTLNYRPHNLPLQSTAFIGRTREVDLLKQQILRSDMRLMTLTGMGGTGKTRLSLQVGAELIDNFHDGVFFVALANELEPGSVASAIAGALGVLEVDGRSLVDSLKDHLKEKEMLVILDNFEQVMGATVLISTFVSGCPNLKFLVTSRSALRIYGEKEFAVPTMTLPNPRHKLSIETLLENETIQLFLNRAQAVKPDFELNTENAIAVVGICHKLDGLPLALELAAARIRLLTPQSMLTRLESRLKILTGGAKDLPARQQTLRAAIDWSYDLLSEEDRSLFRRVAVFVSGCTLEAMESVCIIEGSTEIDVLNETESLVSKSLLRQDVQDDGEPRFTMLETVREYAHEKLLEGGESEVVHEQHLAHYMALSEEAEPKLAGASQAIWLNRLELEHDNMRAALTWALANNYIEQALRIAGALARFWVVRSYLTEGRRRLAEALAVTELQTNGNHFMLDLVGVGGSDDEVRGYIQEGLLELNRVLQQADPGKLTDSALAARAKALNGAGNLSHRQGDYTEARKLYLESLAIRQQFGDLQGVAASFNNLASVAYRQGDYKGARALYHESLDIKRRLGEKRAIASTLNNLGIIAQETGDDVDARQFYQESLQIRRQLSDRHGTSASLEGLGVLTFEAGDFGQARTYLDECLLIRRDLNDTQGIAHALHDLGNLLFAQERYNEAYEHWEESLRLKHEVNDKEGIAASLEAFARLAAVWRNFGETLRLAATAASLRETIGAPLSTRARIWLDPLLQTARDTLGPAAEAIWESGQWMSLEEASAAAFGIKPVSGDIAGSEDQG